MLKLLEGYKFYRDSKKMVKVNGELIYCHPLGAILLKMAIIID